MNHPPSRFPYQNAKAATETLQWQEEYDEASRNYATCALVAQIGNPNISEDVESIMQLHDHFACSADLPLA